MQTKMTDLEIINSFADKLIEARENELRMEDHGIMREHVTKNWIEKGFLKFEIDQKYQDGWNDCATPPSLSRMR